jgi:hypothetical protein
MREKRLASLPNRREVLSFSPPHKGSGRVLGNIIPESAEQLRVGIVFYAGRMLDLEVSTSVLIGSVRRRMRA